MKNKLPIYRALGAFVLVMMCLLSNQVHAQQASVSKTDFITKTGRLSTLIESNEMNGAKRTWESIHAMMQDELAATKSRIRNAVDAHDDASKDRLMSVMLNEAALYSGILKLKDNMKDNKTTFIQMLQQFGGNIL